MGTAASRGSSRAASGAARRVEVQPHPSIQSHGHRRSSSSLKRHFSRRVSRFGERRSTGALVLSGEGAAVQVGLVRSHCAPQDLPTERDLAADYKALSSGLHGRHLRDFGTSENPVGRLVTFLPHAVPILSDEENFPIVSLSRLGKGRVVTFGHASYVNSSITLGTKYTKRLLENCLKLAARERDGEPCVLCHMSGSLAVFGELHCRIHPSSTLKSVEGVDVLVMRGSELTAQNEAQVLEFVTDGGFLLLAHSVAGIGLRQLKDNREVAINGIAPQFGIAFMDSEAVSRKNPHGDRGFHMSPIELSLSDPGRIWAEMCSVAMGTGCAAFEHKFHLLARSLMALPLHLLDGLYQPANVGTQLSPSPKAPITVEMHKERSLLLIQSTTLQEGSVTPASGPPKRRRSSARRQRVVTIDSREVGWQSTGLYAMPGQEIRVLGPNCRCYSIQIGCQPQLWTAADANGKPLSWKRHPNPTLKQQFVKGSAKEAKHTFVSRLGGLIYVCVASGEHAHSFSHPTIFELTIENGSRAPLLCKADPDKEEWFRLLKQTKSPYAELVGSHVILTLPTASLKSFEYPKDLIEVWDDLVDCCKDLTSRSGINGTRRERIVVDAQTVSDWPMQPGYPIVMDTTMLTRLLDVSGLRERGDWGLFHQLGHSFQSSAWTPTSFEEVTCNIPVLYLLEVMTRKTVSDIHPILKGASRKAAFHLCQARGEMPKDPMVMLSIFWLLRLHFGWEPLRQVLFQYSLLPNQELPRDNQDKIDSLVLRLSRATQTSVAAYFADFGLHVSKRVASQLTRLSPWVPTVKKPPPGPQQLGFSDDLNLYEARKADRARKLAAWTAQGKASFVATSGCTALSVQESLELHKTNPNIASMDLTPWVEEPEEGLGLLGERTRRRSLSAPGPPRQLSAPREMPRFHAML